jgi:hypothetical protein
LAIKSEFIEAYGAFSNVGIKHAVKYADTYCVLSVSVLALHMHCTDDSVTTQLGIETQL